jgi:hypothetical protein
MMIISTGGGDCFCNDIEKRPLAYSFLRNTKKNFCHSQKISIRPLWYLNILANQRLGKLSF